jgi:hypothetical protein
MKLILVGSCPDRLPGLSSAKESRHFETTVHFEIITQSISLREKTIAATDRLISDVVRNHLQIQVLNSFLILDLKIKLSF